VLPLIAWLWQGYRAHRQQSDYAEPAFWPWVKHAPSQQGSRWHSPLYFIAWSSLVVALANPLWPQNQTESANRSGVDIVVLLDASRSMSAEDIPPTRFEQARQISESLALRLNQHDRIGLIAFAGQAHWVSPLSEDPSLFRRALYLIDAHQLPLAGSRLQPALTFAQNQLAAIQRAPGFIILLTDGGDLANAPAQIAGQQRIMIGIGSHQTSWLKDNHHPSGWLHDNNQPVNVSVDQTALQHWADQHNIRYFAAEQSEALLNALGQQLAQAADAIEAESQPQPTSLRPLFIAISTLAFMLILPLPRRLPLAAVSLFVLSGGLPNTTWASPDTAYQLFQQQAWQDAEQAFQLRPGYIGYFGAGNAAYRQTQYQRAAFWYRQALLAGETPTQRAQALFNLGNAYMQLQAWELAEEAYQAAQAYHSPYPAAAHNLTLAQQALAQAQTQAQQAHNETKNSQDTEGVRKDLEGSFHGGQKPDPNNLAGAGAQGESDDGRAEGGVFHHREADPSPSLQAQTGQWQIQPSTTQAEHTLRRQRRIEQLELDLSQLNDQQRALLQHLFEREAGFEAKQTQIHTIEGVKPW
jgi:Ca-activated chloride channel family protein